MEHTHALLSLQHLFDCVFGCLRPCLAAHCCLQDTSVKSSCKWTQTYKHGSQCCLCMPSQTCAADKKTGHIAILMADTAADQLSQHNPGHALSARRLLTRSCCTGNFHLEHHHTVSKGAYLQMQDTHTECLKASATLRDYMQHES